MISIAANSIAQGVHGLLSAAFLRSWRTSVVLWLFAWLATSCEIAHGQGNPPALRMAGTNTVRAIQKDATQKSAATAKRLSTDDSSSAVIPASSTLTATRSIIQPANHDEVIIPGAMNSELSSSIACDDCSMGPMAHESMYDYITSDKQHGTHYFLLDWSRSDLWVGTSSFVNPSSSFTSGAGANAGQVEGAFGFQEGFNFGSQLPSVFSGQIGSQVGMRFVQSNLEGTQLSNASRNQMFATAGLFRRVDYGFQGGVVFDYMHDQWIERVDLCQLRGELSFLFSPAHELGFRFTENVRTSQQQVTIPSSGATITSQLRTLDTYRLFGRRRFGPCAASLAEVQLGTSNDGGVLLGCLLQNPLTGQLGLEASANYFIPKGSVAQSDMHEAWHIGIALVWTPGRSFGTQRDYYRPLFEVAGNGSLIATRP